MRVLEKTRDPVVNIALDTISKEKQALVFVNTKRSAEKVAEDISRKTELKSKELAELSEKMLKVIGRPTKQCERLARCVKGGAAFHHAGLHSKQRELIEDAFRAGLIKIIGCTPTLAAGVDLPAYRAIIRDVKRFGMHGMAPIPVLEFLQMAGRAGRPKFDKVGEAIVIASTESERDHITEHYLHGDPEDIFSKLAVEPVLRTYILSLIASRVIRSHDSIIEFFSQTFWAHQYKDMGRMETIIDRMLKLLVDWGFLHTVQEGFRATAIGKRVAELYLDPLTAHQFLIALERARNTKLKAVSWLQLVSYTLEMRPLLRVKQKEYDDIQEKYALVESYLIQKEPSMFEPEFETWMNSLKTSFMLNDWVDEKHEEWILEQYDSRPGETRAKIDTANWLLYACHELSRLMQYQELLSEVTKVRLRLRYGVKEELLPLVRLEGIGRARARILHRNGLKDLGALRKVDPEILKRLLGMKVAASVKEQVGASKLQA